MLISMYNTEAPIYWPLYFWLDLQGQGTNISTITINYLLESSIATAFTLLLSTDFSNATDPAPISSAAPTNPSYHTLDNLTVEELKEWIVSNNIVGQVKQHKKAGKLILN